MKTVTCDKCGSPCKDNNYCSIEAGVELCLGCNRLYWEVREEAGRKWLKDKNPRALYNPEIDR